MKEHIYTIPINDAFDADCECAVCQFMKKEEKNLIEYTLGASMMEPDERQHSNELGYCKRHFSVLLEQSNKLSLALILETHLAEIRKYIEDDASTIISEKKSFFNKEDVSNKIIQRYNEFNDGCVICDRLNNTQKRFIDNIITMYKNNDEFKTKFLNSKGFCIPHFTALVHQAKNILSGKNLSEFYKQIYDIQIGNLSRIQEDIVWFTKKFDFRYANEDWKNSKDAVPRTIEKIIGYVSENDEK